jgi:hypothetical protein
VFNVGHRVDRARRGRAQPGGGVPFRTCCSARTEHTVVCPKIAEVQAHGAPARMSEINPWLVPQRSCD